MLSVCRWLKPRVLEGIQVLSSLPRLASKTTPQNARTVASDTGPRKAVVKLWDAKEVAELVRLCDAGLLYSEIGILSQRSDRRSVEAKSDGADHHVPTHADSLRLQKIGEFWSCERKEKGGRKSQHSSHIGLALEYGTASIMVFKPREAGNMLGVHPLPLQSSRRLFIAGKLLEPAMSDNSDA